MDQQSDRFRWHPGIVGPDQEVSALITLVQSFNDTGRVQARVRDCLLYTSDAADDLTTV